MIIRLSDLTRTEACRIRERQRRGRMTRIIDSDGYICFDSEEYDNWVPKKAGRPPKVEV